MEIESLDQATDTVTLRFVGENEDGTPLHELRAAHVAEVLEGIIGLTSDFTKAGVFGDMIDTEVLVRPAREGSFVLEVFHFVQNNQEAIAGGLSAGGVPTLSQVIWWATKAARADVENFEYLGDGSTVKVVWQDQVAQEIPAAAWDELKKRSRRRRKHLDQILRPLSDGRVSALQVDAPAAEVEAPAEGLSPTPTEFTLGRDDYNAVRPEDEIHESSRKFKTEARMSAIDFDSPDKWRVRTIDANRLATMEDEEFLLKVDRGLPIHKTDIFELKIREDTIEKNGRTTRKWTILKVKSHRRSSNDTDDQS